MKPRNERTVQDKKRFGKIFTIAVVVLCFIVLLWLGFDFFGYVIGLAIILLLVGALFGGTFYGVTTGGSVNDVKEKKGSASTPTWSTDKTYIPGTGTYYDSKTGIYYGHNGVPVAPTVNNINDKK